MGPHVVLVWPSSTNLRLPLRPSSTAVVLVSSRTGIWIPQFYLELRFVPYAPHSSVPYCFTDSMPSNPFKWYSGTRGPYPGRWLVYRSENLSRSIQTPDLENVQLMVSPRGNLLPWDWCCDVLYYDPTQPWLAFIPISDAADYENSARKQSWIYPSHSNNQDNVRPSSRGGYTASLGIIEHAATWLPRIKLVVDDLAQVYPWPHSLPNIPDTKMLALRLDTPDQVLAHLWDFRRPLLSLLGFIHYFISSQYLCAGRSVRDCPALQNQEIFTFVRDHIFTGQSYRGALIETERFHKQFKSDPESCEPILQLLEPQVNSPIPLVIHHPPPFNTVRIPRLNNVLSLPTLKAQLGKQTAYMMKECTARSGIHISNNKVVARARAHRYGVTLQSELDGVNLILFFFDKQPNGQTPSVRLNEEDMDEDDSDLLELEPADFHDFDPQKLRRIPDPLFSFDLGSLENLLASQKPVPGNTPGASNLPMSRSGEEMFPPFEFKLNN